MWFFVEKSVCDAQVVVSAGLQWSLSIVVTFFYARISKIIWPGIMIISSTDIKVPKKYGVF